MLGAGALCNDAAVRASWVGVYERLLGDPGLAAIHPLCRRQRARADVSLADRPRGDGHYRAAFGQLLYAARPGLTLPVWWGAFVKTLLRPIVPAWARRLLGRPVPARRSVA